MKKNREDHMDKENLKKELFELYEKLERDKELYKEFIENEDKFLQDRGFDPIEVKELFQGISFENSGYGRWGYDRQQWSTFYFDKYSNKKEI